VLFVIYLVAVLLTLLLVLGFLLEGIRGRVFYSFAAFLCSAFTGHFRYPSVQRYLHDLVSEIGEHIESITSSLSVFIEIGLFYSSVFHPSETEHFQIQVSQPSGLHKSTVPPTSSTCRLWRHFSLLSQRQLCNTPSIPMALRLKMPSMPSGLPRWCSASPPPSIVSWG
jgi:hypothetical protein